jgi:hypothetical protein
LGCEKDYVHKRGAGTKPMVKMFLLTDEDIRKDIYLSEWYQIFKVQIIKKTGPLITLPV